MDAASADSRWRESFQSEVSVTTATVSPNATFASEAAASADPRQAAAGRPLAAVTGAEIQAPLIHGGHIRYANLDYGASAPALSVVSANLNEILPYYASVHRGAGYASQISTSVYENSRSIVRGFVGGRPDDSVRYMDVLGPSAGVARASSIRFRLPKK